MGVASGTASVGPASEQLVGDDLVAVEPVDLADRGDEAPVAGLGDEHDEVDGGGGEQVASPPSAGARAPASRRARAC